MKTRRLSVLVLLGLVLTLTWAVTAQSKGVTSTPLDQPVPASRSSSVQLNGALSPQSAGPLLATPTATSTLTPTSTNTPTTTPTATSTPTSTPTHTPTSTSTPTSTPTHTPTNTSTSTSTPTPTRTSTPTNTPIPDDDNDGVNDSVEDGAPNNGDGNSDAIPDKQQSNVTSLPNNADGQYVTLASLPGTQLAFVQAVANPSPGDAPGDVEFPVDFFEFTLRGIPNGSATTVTLYLPQGTTVDTYYKYAPSAGAPTPHWYEFLFDGTTGAVINGDVVTLHFVDGGPRGDGDLAANGEILEPGGPARLLAPTGAELRFFTATSSEEDVTLRWETITEIDNLGFNVWRGSEREAGYQRVNRTLVPSAAVGTNGARYQFVDAAVPAGTWYYRLETVSTAGQTDGWHGPVAVHVIPEERRQTWYFPLVVQE